jgi:hypothetical protein
MSHCGQIAYHAFLLRQSLTKFCHHIGRVSFGIQLYSRVTKANQDMVGRREDFDDLTTKK